MKELTLLAVLLLFSGICMAQDAYEPFLGYWIGTLRVMEEEIECQLEFVKQGNELKGYLSIPLQRMKDYPLSNLQVEGLNIKFEVSSAGVTAAFEGSHKKTYISGTFMQEGTGGLFHFVRGEKQESLPAEVISGESNIFVRTHYGNIYGSLLLPDTKEKVPVVLIIAGSGPTDRNGNNPMMGEGNIYRDLALALQKKGIASLRFDKRGIGESSGALVREQDLRFDYFAQDVVLWIDKLRTYEQFSALYLFGHSEGSLLALIAAQTADIDGLISVAGMGRKMDEVLTEQLSAQPEPYKTDALNILNSLKQGIMVQDVKAELRPLFRMEIQPFLLSMLRYDPAKEIAKLKIPVLIMQGTHDLQTNVADAQKLHRANKSSKLVVIDGMNHVMRTSSMDRQANFMTYGTPGLPFSDGFISSIVEFILK